MANFQTFVDRGLQLASARDFMRQDEKYPEATALLAIHTAIALNDAVLLHLTGKRPKSSDHAKAATDTEHACTIRKLNVRGVRHLKQLLAKKTAISYGETATSAELSASLALASERFQEWAFLVLGPTRRDI